MSDAFQSDAPRTAAEAPRALATELAALAVRLIRSDDVVVPREREAVVTALCDCLELDAATAAATLEELLALAPGELPDEREICARVAARPMALRLRWMRGLLDVAAADGSLHRKELLVLSRIAEAVRLPSATFEELMSGLRLDSVPVGLTIPLADPPIGIGRDPGNRIELPSLSVSSHHARLTESGDGWRVEDLGSTSGTWVDGRRVRSQNLRGGELVQIENFCLRFDPRRQRLVVWNQNDFLFLAADGLTVEVYDRKNRRRRRILDDVSCSFHSGELIAVSGPSGAGKTTLVNALLGRVPLLAGSISLNGERCPGLLRRHAYRLGIVPQDDIVHRALSVEEALLFSGSIRAVPGVSRREVERELERVVDELGLSPIRASRIGDSVRRGISGGERKRVNLGQELLNPSAQILILDEPTTGLDPHAGLEIFRLLRQLADRGRLVLVVTHRVDRRTLELVDKMAVLGTDGRLAFFGAPTEMLQLFSAQSIPEVFERLRAAATTSDGAAGAAQQDGAPRRAGRTAKTALLRPAEGVPQSAGRKLPSAQELWTRLRLSARQYSLCTARYARVQWRDAAALAIHFGQVPLIVLGCWLVLQNTLLHEGLGVTPGALPFILVISAFWLGCVASVREIVGEQAIHRREQMAGLRTLPYLGSKITVLAALTFLQSLLLTLTAAAAFGLVARHLDLPRLTLILFLTSLVGVGCGLVASAALRTTEAAVATLPGLVIPQLLFGGLLVSFDRMPGWVSRLSVLMASRWGLEGFLLAGEAGLGDGGQALRGQCALFSVPGKGAMCRDPFLGLLGLARRPDAFALFVPDGSFLRACLALLSLSAALFVVCALLLQRTARR